MKTLGYTKGDIQEKGERRMKKLRVFFAAMALSVSISVPAFTVWAEDMWGQRVQITAHRGDSSRYPENTIPAFQASIEAGADWIELDVSQTKDGIIVVLHDDDLKRTTGRDGKIWEANYDEVKNLAADVKMGPAFKRAGIPTLEEALDVCQGKVKLDIEIKDNGHLSEDFTEQVVKLIRKRNMTEQCMISSFCYEILTKTKALEPALLTGLIQGKTAGREPESCAAADWFVICMDLATPEYVAAIHSLGKQAAVWTVNDPDGVKKCRRADADNLITDKVDYVKESILATAASH